MPARLLQLYLSGKKQAEPCRKLTVVGEVS